MKKIPLRVIKGGFSPADRYAQAELRDRRYSLGDVVFAEIRKPRNPKHHRLAHALGTLVAENVEGFEGLDGHRVLKRLQIEGAIGCDEIALILPGVGPCSYRTPRSLSFESMSQEEFSEIYKRFCDYIVKRYWPGMSQEAIERMAEMVD